MGNQQFTTSHLVFVNCETAVQIHWDWAWTMQDYIIESCGTGLMIVGGVRTLGPLGDSFSVIQNYNSPLLSVGGRRG